MRIYGWQILALCHQPDKSCDHKHYDSGYIMFLICHLTFPEQIFEGLYEFMGGRSSR